MSLAKVEKVDDLASPLQHDHFNQVKAHKCEKWHIWSIFGDFYLCSYSTIKVVILSFSTPEIHIFWLFSKKNQSNTPVSRKFIWSLFMATDWCELRNTSHTLSRVIWMTFVFVFKKVFKISQTVKLVVEKGCGDSSSLAFVWFSYMTHSNYWHCQPEHG